MKIYVLLTVGAAALVLAACGGGGGGGTAGNPEPSAAASLLSTRLLADNQVELSLAGVGQASRFCIRQDSTQPLASDACFSDADSQRLVQTKTLATPSATQRVTFTAWLLKGSEVSLHARMSVPGKTCSQPAYSASSASALPTVCVITDFGESVLALEAAKAPITVAQFLRYVNQGFYEQTVFHRFGKNGFSFAQGGGFTFSNNSYQAKAGTQTAIVLESTLQSRLSNTAGTIAMARTSEPDTANAGFFVNTADNSANFDSSTTRNGYAVFGNFIYGAPTWTNLVASVPAISGQSDVTNPLPPKALQWAYQIK